MNFLRYIRPITFVRCINPLVCAAFCLAVQSCDSDVDDVAVPDEVAIGFDAGIENTRAGQGDIEADGFAVWGGYPLSGVAKEVFTGTMVTYDETDGWTYNPVKYWGTNRTYSFFATYPVQRTSQVEPFISTTDSKIYHKLVFSVPANAATDLLVASPTPVTTDTKPYKTVDLQFTHALSKINIQVQKNGANDEDKVVVNSVSIKNVKKSATYNSETSVWEDGVDGFDFTSADNLNVELEVDENGDPTPTSVVSDLLFIPQTIDANSVQVVINYSFVAGNTVDRFSVGAFLPNTTIAKWESQKVYTYNIILGENKNDILFGIPTVSGWFGNERPVGSTIIIQ